MPAPSLSCFAKLNLSPCILEISPHFKAIKHGLSLYIFIINPTHFSSSGSNVKPVNEEAAESAVTTAPTKPQTEGHQAGAGEVNGFTSPSEETPPVPQSAVQDTPAAPPNTLPGEPAKTIQEPLVKSGSPQDGQPPQKPAVPLQDVTQPHPEPVTEYQPSLPTNGFSMDSSDTSMLSPSSLTDMDLLEAALDDTSSLVPEKPMSEEPAIISVNVQIKESSLHNTDDATQRSESTLTESGSSETSDKITSHLSNTVKQEKGETERRLIVVKTHVQEGVIHKHLDAKSSEGVESWDVPDGLQSEDLPSVSEEVPSSQKPEPKKKPSLFRRSKKKSTQGNLINFNKDHGWDASLLICPGGKLFLFLIPFCILFMGYLSVCT